MQPGQLSESPADIAPGPGAAFADIPRQVGLERFRRCVELVTPERVEPYGAQRAERGVRAVEVGTSWFDVCPLRREHADRGFQRGQHLRVHRDSIAESGCPRHPKPPQVGRMHGRQRCRVVGQRHRVVPMGPGDHRQQQCDVADGAAPHGVDRVGVDGGIPARPMRPRTPGPVGRTRRAAHQTLEPAGHPSGGSHIAHRSRPARRVPGPARRS